MQDTQTIEKLLSQSLDLKDYFSSLDHPIIVILCNNRPIILSTPPLNSAYSLPYEIEARLIEAITEAIVNQDFKTLESYVIQGLSFEKFPTLLAYAISENKPDLVKFLLDHGAKLSDNPSLLSLLGTQHTQNLPETFKLLSNILSALKNLVDGFDDVTKLNFYDSLAKSNNISESLKENPFIMESNIDYKPYIEIIKIISKFHQLSNVISNDSIVPFHEIVHIFPNISRPWVIDKHNTTIHYNFYDPQDSFTFSQNYNNLSNHDQNQLSSYQALPEKFQEKIVLMLNYLSSIFKIQFILSDNSTIPEVEFGAIYNNDKDRAILSEIMMPTPTGEIISTSSNNQIAVFNLAHINDIDPEHLSYLFLHEICHMLGLSHQSERFSETYTSIMAPTSSSPINNIISTLLPSDIWMLSQIYGLNITGQDSYFKIDGNQVQLHSLVGSGGKDTIDASSYEGDSFIALYPTMLNKVGDNYFYVGPVMTNIIKIIGSQGQNVITLDLPGEHVIDLRSSKKSNTIIFNENSDDTCYFDDNVKDHSLKIYPNSQGEKHIKGFNLDQGHILLKNPEDNSFSNLPEPDYETIRNSHELHLGGLNMYFED